MNQKKREREERRGEVVDTMLMIIWMFGHMAASCMDVSIHGYAKHNYSA